MIEINIPGRGSLRLEHLVTDVNGTLAIDGQLIEGVAQRIELLKDRLTIHMLTADTHGKQVLIDQQLNLTAVRIQPGNESEQKADYIRQLGAEKVVALGQGANDAGMLKEAALGIHRVVNVQMAEGIRLVSISRGVDPRHFSLMPFGGAGALHAGFVPESRSRHS